MTSVDTDAAATPDRSTPPAAATDGPSSLLLGLIALATGALVANLYYAQPLIAVIGPDIGVRPELAGAVVSVTQIGYALGLFFLVSLADLVESRKLVLIAMSATVLALGAAATSSGAAPFFIASLVVGLSATGAQVLVPFVSHLVPEAKRGRTVGNVMAGLLTGILIARPLALFISAGFGWRAVFWISAVLMVAIGLLLARLMPRYVPHGGLSYRRILGSMVGLIRETPVLRRRAAYQSLMFAAFNLFWTAVPLLLAQRFGLGQMGIALFALAGAGGALAAPIAGRLADRGHIRAATFAAMAVLTLCFFATGWAASAGALAVLAVLAILIDAAVQLNQVVSQRVIFSLPAPVRGRVNAIYMTTAFFGGAFGSILATASYHWGGWTATAAAGGVIGVLALLVFATEPRAAK
jgi:predicted MFS family arabinose efflux permease